MLSFLFWIFAILSRSVYSHYGCGTDRVKHKKAHKNINVKPIEPFTNNLASDHNNHPKIFSDGRAQNPDNTGIYSNIRIHYDTSQLERDWSSYHKKDYFVHDVIPAAYEWLMKVISVRPVNGPLTFDVGCDSNDGIVDPFTGLCVQPNDDWQECGDTGAIIPKFMFDEQQICPFTNTPCETTSYPQGIGMPDTDLIIYFTGDPTRDNTNVCDNMMGFAAYCHTNARDRPIAGYINLCKSTIDATDVLTWEQTISLIVHQTFHVLGFSADGFVNFKMDDGTDRTRTDVYASINKRGKLRAVITLPTVVQKAREFFGCDTMDGIELEDYGLDAEFAGELTSHWDNRIIVSDVMISYVPPAAPYGIFTLAVLQDSGWYNIDWSYAQQAPPGRGNGCQWYDNKCISGDSGSLKSIDASVFCTENVEFSCSASYVGKFYCGLSQWNVDLPKSMQYFEQPTAGGDNVYPDFCPLLEEYSNGDCRLWGHNNRGTSDENTAALGGLITGTSKCGLIESSVNGLSAGCYPTECFVNYKGEYVGTRMTIYSNFHLKTFDVITCWSDEDEIAKQFAFRYDPRTNFAFDTIYCPVFKNICYDENPWICSGHGTIVNGKCICSPGYFGIDCTIESNAINRAKYTELDSLSVYMNKVCHDGIWNYSISDANVGILNIQVNGIQSSNYIESYFQIALKNMIAVLTDISQCDVKLIDYKYDDSTTVNCDIYYYSSDKTWADVTASQSQIVFNKLFDSANSMQIQYNETIMFIGRTKNNHDITSLNKPNIPTEHPTIIALNTIRDIDILFTDTNDNVLGMDADTIIIIASVCVFCCLMIGIGICVYRYRKRQPIYDYDSETKNNTDSEQQLSDDLQKEKSLSIESDKRAQSIVIGKGN